MTEMLHCEFCRYISLSSVQMGVHRSKCHEQELANEGAAQRAKETLQAQNRSRRQLKPEVGFTLERFYGKDYFICPQCRRPALAKPTAAHPEPGVCRNLYWLRSDWLHAIKSTT